MSDYPQPSLGEKRNAPIWQVVGVVIVLMGISVGSFMLGKQHPAPDNGSGSYGSNYSAGSSDTSGSTDTSGGSNYYGGGSQATQYLTLQNLIGYGSTSVEQALRSSGLIVFTHYTTGDPSINERLNNGCPVVDQSPAAGTDVAVGSTVTILADCPMTGY